MDRTPSDENADNDASNKTPEPNPENDIQSDAADESAPALDNDESSSDKNYINDSEPEPEGLPDVSNVENEPDLEIVAEEQEGASEAKVTEKVLEEDAPVEDSPGEEAPEEKAPAEAPEAEDPEEKAPEAEVPEEELAPEEEAPGQEVPNEELAPEEEAPGEEVPNEQLAPEEEAPEEEATEKEVIGDNPPEEIPDLAEVEEVVLGKEATEDKASPEEALLVADDEEVPQDVLPSEELDQEEKFQEEGIKEKAEEEEASPSYGEAEAQPRDVNKIADSIIEYIEEAVLTNEKVMDASDSGQLALLAEGIVTAIISGAVVPSMTGVNEELEDEIGVVPEGAENVEETEEAGEAENEDDLFPMLRKVVMLDKAVQAIAKEIDEALEALSAESLPLEEEACEVEKSISAESGVTSEAEGYQSCEDVTEVELPCGEGSGNVPCPYLEETGEEPAKEEGASAVDMEDESQWEDLADEEDENGPVPTEGAELNDQQGEFEPLDTSEQSVPQDSSIPSEFQETYTPIAQGEEDTPIAQAEVDTPIAEDEADSQSVRLEVDTPGEPVEVNISREPVEANAPSGPAVEYSPIAPPTNAASPTAQQDTLLKSIADPDRVKRSESLGGTKPAPPTPAPTKPRAVASDTQRSVAAQPAVTPRREEREPCETCEWQQAFGNLKDHLFESPYNYICKFVVLCVAIRAIRSILLRTRCG